MAWCLSLCIATLFIRFQYSFACVLTLVSHALISTFAKKVIFADMLRPKGLLNHDLLYFVPGVEVHMYTLVSLWPYHDGVWCCHFSGHAVA